jgi:hypothetical protein
MLQTSQVLSRRLCVSCAAVLPFKDSEGGTWPLQLSDFKKTCICRHAPVKKQSQYANRSMRFAPQQQFGPAVSEAAEPPLRYGQRDQAAGYPSLVWGAASLDTKDFVPSSWVVCRDEKLFLVKSLSGLPLHFACNILQTGMIEVVPTRPLWRGTTDDWRRDAH